MENLNLYVNFMKTILFVSYNELHVTWGGVHRVNHLLMEAFTNIGYRCLYLVNKNGKYFYINNKESQDNKLDVAGLREYLINQNVGYIIDQEGVFTDSFNLAIKGLRCKDIKLLTVFHSTPCIYDRLYNYRWLYDEFRKKASIGTKLSYLARLVFYPLWRKYAKAITCKRYSNIYNISDRVVFLSRNDIPTFKWYVKNVKDSKCVAINNALTFSEMSSPQILSEKENVVLIVSRLNDNEKRISKALQIWKRIEQAGMSDWKLVIVGTGPHEDTLKSMAQKMSLRNVCFEGRQESEPYYRNASLFMMTSAVEGWGLTLTESMQRAVVPLAFDSYPALSDIVTDGFDGCIIPDNDICLYASRMLELMRNKKERERIAINALESCQRFSADKIVRKWVELIESL